MLQSGVHATIAGILLALFIPLRVTDPDKQSPLARLEHGINPWVTFLILPLFGFANAGVALSGMTADDLMSPVPVGVALGLFVGKQAGIFGLSLLAVSLGLAKRPEKVPGCRFTAYRVLCGIGFTMSLFIGNLAFAESPLLVDEVKVGVLAGSVLAALAGMLILRFSPSHPSGNAFGSENPRDDGDFYFPANLLINRATFITVGIYSGAYHHTGARIYSLPKNSHR